MNIPLNIDWQQILLHLFNFGILAAGLYYLLYKPVKDFMAKREAYYQQMESEANNKIEEANELHSKYENQLAALDQEMEQKRSQVSREIDVLQEKEIAEAHAMAEQILTDARTMAQQEKTRIVKEAQKEIAEMVSQETEKLVLKSVSDAYDQFLDIAEGSVTDAS
ncbi:MAG: ATP synthase F0 subunit B [Eubacteriales bacterium]|nr:ATP synthase F0 subunit B [Eubacteriales bacterium]